MHHQMWRVPRTDRTADRGTPPPTGRRHMEDMEKDTNGEQEGDFAKGQETEPESEHVGDFATGEEKGEGPEVGEVEGDFAKGQETEPESEHRGDFAEGQEEPHDD
jgi:hypothetical protein